MDAKSVKLVFIGYSEDSKAYRCFNPVTKKVHISREVTFFEEKLWAWRNDAESDARAFAPIASMESELVNTSSFETQPSDPSFERSDDSHNSREDIEPQSSSTTSPPAPERYRRLEDIYNCSFALTAADPSTFEEASKHEGWMAAMRDEMESIQKNQTWYLTALPEGKKAIGLKWIYKTKLNPDGSELRKKARIVAKGFAQQEGIDFTEVFSPVARMETVRVFMAVGAQRNWQIFQLDVKTAFLNGDISEDVYVSQPEGYIVKGKEQLVYKLRKALYGLRQAPRAWYGRIDQEFIQMGFTRSINEPTVYTKFRGNSEILILCIYVDDILYMGSSVEMLSEFKEKMSRTFEMTDLGCLRYFLGLEVVQSNEGLFVSQQKYAEDLLKKTGMLNCRKFSTPMNANEKLSLEDSSGKTDPVRYRKVVGSLFYLTHTRPDLVFAVGIVSRFMQSPSLHHFGTVKRILHYVAGTIGHGLMYTNSEELKLCGFTDSDWGGVTDERRSTSGWCFSLGSAAVAWRSKKQLITALSSTEAEYIAATSAACEAVWLRRLLSDFGMKFTEPTVIQCDNKSAISITRNPTMHGRTKHIDTRFHFIRDLVCNGEISVVYCSTNEQVADIFTKALPSCKFEYFREALGVTSL